MIISVASGKGGTGKTTVAVNLSLSLNNVQFLDCDVEEPNAHIFLKPRIEGEKRQVFLCPKLMKQNVLIAVNVGSFARITLSPYCREKKAKREVS